MEICDPYSVFCNYYDEVLSHVSKRKWKDFILSEYLAQKKKNPTSIVDLACGTGSLIAEFADVSELRMGMDLSGEMLNIAKKANPTAKFSKGNLKNFQFNEKADLVICTHDSLNYLNDQHDLESHFQCLKEILQSGGLYFFDVTSEKNLMQNFHRQSTEEHLKDGRLVWSNRYLKKEKKIISNLEFFTRRGNWKEIHVQKYFSVDEIQKILQKTGFRVLRMGGDYEKWDDYQNADLINFVIEKKCVFEENIISK